MKLNTLNTAIASVALIALGKVAVNVLSKWAETLLTSIFLKTKEDIIVWTHYKSHSARDGHAPKTPVECTDGRCKEV